MMQYENVICVMVHEDGENMILLTFDLFVVFFAGVLFYVNFNCYFVLILIEIANFSINGTKHSRMDQVKFV